MADSIIPKIKKEDPPGDWSTDSCDTLKKASNHMPAVDPLGSNVEPKCELILGDDELGHTVDPLELSSSQLYQVARNRALEEHAITHTARKRYECEICFMKFLHESYFSEHKAIHSGLEPFECQICLKTFGMQRLLDSHSITHWRKHECKICGKKVSSVGLLERHVVQHSDTITFRCRICNRTFFSESQLENHVLSHPVFQCVVCPKRTSSKSNLKTHMLTHSDVRPFQCEICAKCDTLNKFEILLNRFLMNNCFYNINDYLTKTDCW